MKNALLKYIIIFLTSLMIWSCAKYIEPIPAKSNGIIITSDNDFKVPTNVKFSAVATNSSSVKWEFYKNNIQIDPTTTEQSQSPTRFFKDVGDYTVIFKAIGNGGSSGTNRTFNIQSDVDFTYTGGNCEAPCEVVVNATTFDKSIISAFEWNWGDQTASTQTSTLSAKHTYTKEGNYFISLNVKYSNGINATIPGKSVTIKAPPLLISKITNAWSGGGNGDDLVVKVVTDQQGNVFVAGDFRGSASFGDKTLSYKETNPQSYGAFLAKYNNTGSILWVKPLFYNDNFVTNFVKDIAVSNTGDIYIALQVFNNSIASCLLKLNQNGDYYNNFTRLFANVFINCLGLDKNQNVFIGGNFDESFEGKSYYNRAAGETNRGFIAKYNSAGVLQPNWPQVFSGGKSSSVDKLAIAKDNSVAITGIFSGNYNFGGNKSISGPGTSQPFFSKYDTNGSMQWIQQDGIGNTGNVSNPNSIVTDDENNPIVAINRNTTSSVITIGSKAFNFPAALKSFIVRFNNDGSPDFAIQGSPDDDSYVRSLFKDNDGNIILATANSISKINIKGIFISKNLPLFNNSSNATVNSITSDANNTIFLTGAFKGNLTTTANIQTLNSRGENDMFILRFGK